MDTTETPKVAILHQQQLLLDLDVREVCGDLDDGIPLSATEYNVRDHGGYLWALHRGEPLGEVQTQLNLRAITETLPLASELAYTISVYVPLLGNLTIYQHHILDPFDNINNYFYKIGIGLSKPSGAFKCAATEIQRRFEMVSVVRVTSQRRAGLRDIATLISRLAAKKDLEEWSNTSLQIEQDDIHSTCGNTQSGKSANSTSLEINTMTTTATVTKDGDKFVCTLGATILGSSKHFDYFEYHLRKGDVKALREAGITHIDYVDGTAVTKTVSVVKAKVPNAATVATGAVTVAADAVTATEVAEDAATTEDAAIVAATI